MDNPKICSCETKGKLCECHDAKNIAYYNAWKANKGKYHWADPRREEEYMFEELMKRNIMLAKKRRFEIIRKKRALLQETLAKAHRNRIKARRKLLDKQRFQRKK